MYWQLFEEQVGIGGVLALLWFRKLLPPYATHFLEMVLMVTADHGPAVGEESHVHVEVYWEKTITSLKSHMLYGIRYVVHLCITPTQRPATSEQDISDNSSCRLFVHSIYLSS